MIWPVMFAALSALLAARAGAAEPSVSFNREIQPILSEYCYHCHGPDSASRKPKKHPLRLDRAQFAFEARDDGKPVIIQGNAAGSELVRRIKAPDEDDVMPPPSEHKKMSAREIALLERWIGEGARYEEHWSFIAPRKAQPPADSKGWAKTPVDQFVARKLAENGLSPNPEEEKGRLLRRLTFDLTGLPPTRTELRLFLKNNSPKAYEETVDRLLSSKACAEHFARIWLDAVRYADTQGIHHDHSRTIWLYRDWVIAAFRSNMPFDAFTERQIAGDLLKEPALEDKVASGYNRLLPTTGEGGAIGDEYKAIYAKDRVDTTSAVWLGLTMGCATCHDHKFDPITTRDFYSMTAFFRNSTQPALDKGTSGETAPLLFVAHPEDRARWPKVEETIKERKEALENRRKEGASDFEQWLETLNPKSPDDFVKARPTIRFPETNVIQTADNDSTNLPPTLFGPVAPLLGAEFVTGFRPDVPRTGKASWGAYIWVEDKPSGAVMSRMNAAEKFRGWDIYLVEGKPATHIVDAYPDAALKVTAKSELKPKQWHHVLVVFDGARSGADAVALYVDGEKADVEVNNNSLGSNITANATFRLGSRADATGSANPIKDGKVYVQQASFYSQALNAPEVARLAAAGLSRDYVDLPEENRGEERKEKLKTLFFRGFDAPALGIEGQLALLNLEEARIRERGATTLVMEEKKDSEPSAHILIRGNYANKGEQVGAATPAALPAMPAGEPRNRLGLAHWLVSPTNPLTARVTVNRLWANLFGAGIVETTEDFGVMGSRPVNQDLLDWLAVDFTEGGWNYRRLVKTIVTSAAYKQSAVVTPEKLERDPRNLLISRGPRYRLDAEQIRDQALFVSGLLVPRLGGPPVKPYQPEGVWEAVAMKDSNTREYKQDHGDALYRRSMYTFWKRTAPPPNMEILNAPSREVFCTRRERTDTPLQAFVTMNDTQFVEASRQLATLAIKSARSFDERLDFIYESLLARSARAAERPVAKKLFEKALSYYRNKPSAADALTLVGESKADPRLDVSELASWTLVASEVMNLDEALSK
jgi:hypothetical protein